MQQKRNPARVCSRIGFGLFAMLGSWMLCVVLLSMVLARAWPRAASNFWVMMLLNDIPLYFIGVPLFLLITAFVPSAPKVKSPRFHFHVGHYLVAVVFVFGAGYVLALAAAALQGGVQQLFRLGGAANLLSALSADDPWATLLFLAVIPAFGEEFVFRYMLRRKMGECGDLSYVMISALSFSLFHVNLSQLFFAFVLGALFAWLYVATGKLWVAISLHFMFNVTNALLMPMFLRQFSDNLLAILIIGFVLLLLMAAGITLFFVFRKWVLATMRPPAEPGWPHRPPRWLPLWQWKRRQKRMGLPLVMPLPMGAYPPAVMRPYPPPPMGAYPPPVGMYPPPMRMCPLPVGSYPPSMAYPQPMPRPSTLPYAAAMRPAPPPFYGPRPRYKSAASVCVGNPGMIVYIAVSGVLTLVMTLSTLLI